MSKALGWLRWFRKASPKASNEIFLLPLIGLLIVISIKSGDVVLEYVLYFILFLQTFISVVRLSTIELDEILHGEREMPEPPKENNQ